MTELGPADDRRSRAPPISAGNPGWARPAPAGRRRLRPSRRWRSGAAPDRGRRSRPPIGGLVARCCGRASGRRGSAGRSSRSTTVASTTWCSSPGWPVDVVGGPHGFSGVMNTVLPRKRLIAHVLMRDDEGGSCCATRRSRATGSCPVASSSRARRPATGAIREVREELGHRPRGGPAAGGGLAAAVPGLGGRGRADLRRRAGDRGRSAAFSLQENEIRSVDAGHPGRRRPSW